MTSCRIPRQYHCSGHICMSLLKNHPKMYFLECIFWVTLAKRAPPWLQQPLSNVVRACSRILRSFMRKGDDSVLHLGSPRVCVILTTNVSSIVARSDAKDAMIMNCRWYGHPLMFSSYPAHVQNTLSRHWWSNNWSTTFHSPLTNIFLNTFANRLIRVLRWLKYLRWVYE